MKKITCSDLPQRWYQKIALPDFTVSLEEACSKESNLVIIAMNEFNEPLSKQEHAFEVPAGVSSVDVSEKFRFPDLTRRTRNHLHCRWMLNGVVIAEGKSNSFQIMSRRLKGMDDCMPWVDEPTLDTLLLHIPRVGLGYARRFALGGIHTVRDLAETTKTQLQL